MKELLEPVYQDDERTNVLPFALGGLAVVVVLVVGAFMIFAGSDEPQAASASTAVTTSIADDGSVVEVSSAEEPTEVTATTTTLDPSATQPEEAMAAALHYIEIEEDPEALEEFFSEIDKFVYFITVLRNPNEIGRYMQRHAPNTDNYEILDDGTPTTDGTVIFEVDYTYNGNPAQVTWEIGMADGKVTLFAADGR